MAQSHPRPRRQALGPQEHQSLATGRQMHQDGREAARVPEEAMRGHQAPQLIGQGGSSKPHPESRPRACRRMSGRGSRGAERARSLAGGRLPSPRHLAPPPHPTPRGAPRTSASHFRPCLGPWALSEVLRLGAGPAMAGPGLPRSGLRPSCRGSHSRSAHSPPRPPRWTRSRAGASLSASSLPFSVCLSRDTRS